MFDRIVVSMSRKHDDLLSYIGAYVLTQVEYI